MLATIVCINCWPSPPSLESRQSQVPTVSPVPTGISVSTKQRSLGDILQEFSQHRQIMQQELQKVIVGQTEVIEQLFAAIFTRGHCLLEGVPGLAKTLMVSTLARILDVSFNRIQFTPDLMPSDIIGTNVLEEDESGRRSFRFVKGPIFNNIVLADEINRTPPKTQAALLQAMQEREVTIGGTTYPLPKPFFVIATQNPIEQEGTYPLPEAQMDRFLMKMSMGYPDRQEEKAILQRRKLRGKDDYDIEQITSPKKVVAMQKALETVHVDPAIMSYIVELVQRTREDHRVITGASPRASQSLFKTSRASAAIDGRDYVIPDDIKNVALEVVSHRILLKPESKIRGVTGRHITRKILSEVPVPVIQ